jgi:hypothetical protein
MKPLSRNTPPISKKVGQPMMAQLRSNETTVRLTFHLNVNNRLSNLYLSKNSTFAA